MTSPPIAIVQPVEPTETLLGYLLDKYRKLPGPSGHPDIDRQRIEAVVDFVHFALTQLTVSRPVGIRAVASNYALVMRDGTELLICPAEQTIRGTMHPVMGVPVNPDPSVLPVAQQLGDQGAVPISGAAAHNQSNFVDYRCGSRPVDKRITGQRIQPINPDPFTR